MSPERIIPCTPGGSTEHCERCLVSGGTLLLVIILNCLYSFLLLAYIRHWTVVDRQPWFLCILICSQSYGDFSSGVYCQYILFDVHGMQRTRLRKPNGMPVFFCFTEVQVRHCTECLEWAWYIEVRWQLTLRMNSPTRSLNRNRLKG